MYTPKMNAEEDVTTLRAFVRENSLCALVTRTEAGLVASHIPMVLHEDGAGFGTLRGHLARANPQWKELAAEKEALGIFTGPQHYISASWYPGKATHGKEVPTWNYTAVHVYGRVRVIEDTAWLLEHLQTLTDLNEVIARVPWKVSDAPAEFVEKLSGGIVGVEMPVERVEGKWKVSQNRTEADVEGVVRGLGEVGTRESKVMGELVVGKRPR